MLVHGLTQRGVRDDQITLIADEQQAIEAALSMARAGDLLLVFADALARGWKQIVNFRPDESARVASVPRAARAVPRQAVHEESPADDVAPAKSASTPAVAPSRWDVAADEIVLMRDERGVILAPEASD